MLFTTSDICKPVSSAYSTVVCLQDIYGKHQLMNGSDKLRLVSVCDKETGVCLFQRTWQWRGEQERSGIGNLVQSFYQFAREVDEGGESIKYVFTVVCPMLTLPGVLPW